MPRARAWSCSVGDSASEASTQPQRGGTYPRRSVLMRGMTLLIGSQARGERVRTFVAEAHDGPVDIEQAKTTPKSGRSPRFGQCCFLRTSSASCVRLGVSSGEQGDADPRRHEPEGVAIDRPEYQGVAHG